MEATMLLTARYVLPISAPHIEDGAVLVQGDTIVDVGLAADLRAAHPDEEVREWGQAALMPGFVDLHTHLEYSAFRGLVDDLPYTDWKMQVLKKEAGFSDSDWADSATLGALEALSSGITTIADISNTGASLRAALAAGFRGVVYREVATMVKSEVPGVLAEGLEQVGEWQESAKDSLFRVGIAPHAPYSCHPELYRGVADAAIAQQLPVATHLAGSRDEYNFVKYGSSPLASDLRRVKGWEASWLPTGVSPVRYLLQWGFFDVPDVLAIHCVQVDDEDIEVLAQRDVAVAYCPRCSAKWGMGIAPLKRFMDRGIRIGIGTDSPASNNTIDFFDEMRIGLLLQRGMSGDVEAFTSRRFVRMATTWGARALRLEDRIGSLAPGMQADIIGIDLSTSHQVPTLDPYSAIVYTANQENVLFTMVAGNTLFESGEYATIDAERAMAHSEELRVKLRG
jgi:5-methylthioadenosine/S-adenosylhomocysteine deaminase